MGSKTCYLFLLSVMKGLHVFFNSSVFHMEKEKSSINVKHSFSLLLSERQESNHYYWAELKRFFLPSPQKKSSKRCIYFKDINNRRERSDILDCLIDDLKWVSARMHVNQIKPLICLNFIISCKINVHKHKLKNSPFDFF